MKLLMLCTTYALDPGNEYLTNDLAIALTKRGHQVQVVLIDWSKKAGSEISMREIDGVRVLVIPPLALSGLGNIVYRVSKWIASPIYASSIMKRHLGGQKFDGVICYSPLSAVGSVLTASLQKYAKRSYAVMWDFFPYYHHNLGLVPSGLIFWAAKLYEQNLVSRIDVVGVMSPRNVLYFVDKYDVRSSQTIEVLRLWGRTELSTVKSVSDTRVEFDLPVDKEIVLFGGQMSEGRSVEDIIAAAEKASEENIDVHFLLIGDGRLSGVIEDKIANGDATNITYRRRIPRDEYLKLAACCTIGLSAEHRDLGVPSFPSKIIDYLRAGLPIIAAVEEATDFGEFIEQNGLGIAVPGGSSKAILDAVVKLLSDEKLRDTCKINGRKALKEVFDVTVAAEQIESHFR